MYLIFTVTIIILLLLFYFFKLEVNINIISIIIIILLLNSLFYKKTYEKFNVNDINVLQDKYSDALDAIKDEYARQNLEPESEYNKINIDTSEFNEHIFDNVTNGIEQPCNTIPFNGKYLSGDEFINLLTKLQDLK